MRPSQPPHPGRNWALFLDIDGTLLDIAPGPRAVVVPEGLQQILLAACQFLAGALALVSGRPLEDIDRLMAPLRLPCAAEHGAVLRFSDGSVRSHSEDYAVPAGLRDRMREKVHKWPGAVLEEKQFNVVIHFRQVPNFAVEIGKFANAVAWEAGPQFEALPARMAFEVRHRNLNKGSALRAFMTKIPFVARVPVFVGDDVTDNDGFAASRDLGGLALEVSEAFDGEPRKVRHWLQTFS